ncbi:MAG: SDR family oxidoreductase [Bacteroidetes bacterium]|nr:SDR family oxidoreductase [Bacteroidota bacterium]
MIKTKYHSKDLTRFSFLITGGAGFIGSNLVEYLLKYGAGKVRVLDDLSTGFYKNIEFFKDHTSYEFIKGDIRDPETCKKACEGIDVVFHQAALGSVPRSIKDPISTNSVNIDGFLNMLVAARDNKVERFIYAASSSTYGDSEKLPKVEEVIGKPLSPYAVTKLTNELYAGVFANELKTIGLRYFNIFGPKQDPKGAYAAVIPIFINAVINNKSPEIFGDGGQTRDFTFIENAVQGNMKAAFTENGQAVNQVFNIAAGKKTSVNQLFQLICQQVNSLNLPGTGLPAIHKANTRQAGDTGNLKPIYRAERPGDVRHSLADISKAEKALDYKPAFSLEKGLKITLEWFIKNY